MRKLRRKVYSNRRVGAVRRTANIQDWLSKGDLVLLPPGDYQSSLRETTYRKDRWTDTTSTTEHTWRIVLKASKWFTVEEISGKGDLRLRNAEAISENEVDWYLTVTLWEMGDIGDQIEDITKPSKMKGKSVIGVGELELEIYYDDPVLELLERQAKELKEKRMSSRRLRIRKSAAESWEKVQQEVLDKVVEPDMTEAQISEALDYAEELYNAAKAAENGDIVFARIDPEDDYSYPPADEPRYEAYIFDPYYPHLREYEWYGDVLEEIEQIVSDAFDDKYHFFWHEGGVYIGTFSEPKKWEKFGSGVSSRRKTSAFYNDEIVEILAGVLEKEVVPAEFSNVSYQPPLYKESLSGGLTRWVRDLTECYGEQNVERAKEMVKEEMGAGAEESSWEFWEAVADKLYRMYMANDPSVQDAAKKLSRKLALEWLNKLSIDHIVTALRRGGYNSEADRILEIAQKSS